MSSIIKVLKAKGLGRGIAAGAFVILLSLVPMLEGKTNHAIIPVPGDVPTLCYGYTKGVQMGDTATDEECIEYLKEELEVALAAVDRLVKVDITEQERAAYASFVYNVGAGAFSRSTLLRRLNSGDRVGACNEMLRWVYVKGRKVRGLQNRRAVEVELCLMGAKQ
jgi:lysozyme